MTVTPKLVIKDRSGKYILKSSYEYHSWLRILEVAMFAMILFMFGSVLL